MQNPIPIPALLAIGAALATTACGRRAHPAPRLPPPLTSVVFIREMDPLPGVNAQPVAVTPGVRSVFDTAWPRVSGEVTALATPDELTGISRWARGLMPGHTLPEDWIGRMPMEPVGTTAQGEVVFSQTPEQSPVDLPSQTAIVRRRLIVAAVVDPASRTIPRVYVTIRGWAEE
jgi:hypothetical protein